MKKVYVSETEGSVRRGRPLGRWKNRVKEYMSERGATRGEGLEQASRECLGRERWRLFCRGHPLGERSRKERGVRAIDKQTDKTNTMLTPVNPILQNFMEGRTKKVITSTLGRLNRKWRSHTKIN